MDKTNKAENMKDKVKGEFNDKVGKATGNKKMEIKGKAQSAKADVKEKINTKGKTSKKK